MDVPGKTIITYKVDINGKIISVDDAWMSFATENNWPVKKEQVVGHFLWDFIDSAEVKYLYHLLMERAKFKQQFFSIPYRCDSPGVRRYMEMEILYDHNDCIYSFNNSVLRLENREPVEMLDPAAVRDKRLVKICSWCKDVNVNEQRWVTLEKAVQDYNLLSEGKSWPVLSHGVCPECSVKVKKAVKGSVKLLVVDDDPVFADICSMYLQGSGYSITIAPNGDDALSKLDADNFDLVIVDVFMPDKDGLETISEIKQKYPAIKIIAMTGMEGVEEKDQYIKAAIDFGADSGILKPFEPEELENLVDLTLQCSR